MKYDRIGIGYDATRRADLRIAAILARLLEPRPGARYLDAACGTGNYTRAVKALGLDMTGVDQSETMLAVARAKATDIGWHQGDVTALPFADGTFAGAMCTMAVHHFTDRARAFAEITRVIRAPGSLVILTSLPEQLRGYWLNAYFPDALRRSAEQMPKYDAMETLLASCGLRLDVAEPWSVPRDPVDLFLYSGKHNPHLYLDPNVRSGISTFASLAEPAEVEQGVARLEQDIASGAIAHVMARYANETGDYMFLAARKN